MRWLPLVLALGCSGSENVRSSAPWRADSFLRDREGRAVILRGLNVGAKSAPWFDFQGPKDFARIRSDWGMNSVRLIMQWAAIEPQPGKFDDAYLEELALRVKWAQDAKLFVVVDMHQDIYGEGFWKGGGDGAPKWTCDESHYANFVPVDPWFVNALNKDVLACYDGFWSRADLQEHFALAWKKVAMRLVGFESIIGFDILNEPYWGTYSAVDFEPDRLQPLYERVVPVVRSIAPNWVAFLEPSSLRNGGGKTQLVRPTFGNYAYAPHSYDRTAESGMGFDASRRQAILSNVTALAQEARELGGPLWIGEYGGMNSAPGIVDYMSAQYDAAGSVAASSMYWSYAKGGYGILNQDGSEAMPLADVLVRPYPERVAGDPIDWMFHDNVFTMHWHPKKMDAPTIISVPARRYPNGYHVTCACTWHAEGNSIVVTSASSDPAELRIAP